MEIGNVYSWHETSCVGNARNAVVYAHGEVIAPRSVLTQKKNTVKGFHSDVRTFKWTNRTRRIYKARVSAILANAPHNRGYFITLTYDQSVENNKAIGLFIQNLVKRGIVYKYAWVRERQKNGKNHYHVIFTSYSPICIDDKTKPYLFTGCTRVHYTRRKIAKIFVDAWCSAVTTAGGKAQENSVRFGYNPVIDTSLNASKVANYCSKYCSKSEIQESYRICQTSEKIQAVVSIPKDYIYNIGRVIASKVTEFAHCYLVEMSLRDWITAIQICDATRQPPDAVYLN